MFYLLLRSENFEKEIILEVFLLIDLLYKVDWNEIY